jgi:hypothetical protein
LISHPEKITFDPSELAKVEWISIDDACKLPNLKDRRKDILKLAYEKK